MAAMATRSQSAASETRQNEEALRLNDDPETEVEMSSPRPFPNNSQSSSLEPEQLLKRAVIEIWRDPTISFDDKSKRIQQIHLAMSRDRFPGRNNHACVEQSRCDQSIGNSGCMGNHPVGAFPGRGAPPCSHYRRKCWLKAACCQRYYPCRRCHDEAESHEIDRHATEFVGCTACGASEQPVGPTCANCSTRFASYYCNVCKFFDESKERSIYHCPHCGICRVGEGLGIDNHHCHGCNACLPIEAADSHPCIIRSLDSNCPICSEYMATSTSPVIIVRCGHAMHTDCYKKHTKTRYTCPICCKSLVNMEKWYRALDERLSGEILPTEFARKMSRIYCHDCEIESDAKFHFQLHMCRKCRGYNTRVVRYFEVTSDDGSENEVDMDLSDEAGFSEAGECDNCKVSQDRTRDIFAAMVCSSHTSRAVRGTCSKPRGGSLTEGSEDCLRAGERHVEISSFTEMGILGPDELE